MPGPAAIGAVVLSCTCTPRSRPSRRRSSRRAAGATLLREFAGIYARGGGSAGGVARVSGEGETKRTRSVENVASDGVDVAKTAGSRDSCGAWNVVSEPSIEQLFAQPACLRRGHVPEALQQHAARDGVAIIAIDGNRSAARTTAVMRRCTGTIVDSLQRRQSIVFGRNEWARFERRSSTNSR